MVSRLLRKSFLTFLAAVTLHAHLVANAASAEDNIEKDIQQEELNLNAQEEQTHANSIPSSDIIPVESGTTNTALSNGGYIIDEREPLTDGNVVVEKPVDYTLPYKKRRSKHGVLFSVGLEKIEPTEYYSMTGTFDVPISEMFGNTTIDMVGLELGYKYNFSLGSIFIIGGYSMGSTSDDTVGAVRKLSLTKQSLAAGFAADAIFDEPWVVPYAQAGVHQFEVNETLNDEEQAHTTQPCLNYRFGMLFQLNWIEKAIDPSTHQEGLRSSGLENTYLDVYTSFYQPSASVFDPTDPDNTLSEDPNLQAEGTIGVALKMEF